MTGSPNSEFALERASRRRDRRWSRRTKAVSALLGALLASSGAYAASNWIVGLNAGSSGEGQSAGIANLTISAVASPAATNLLYPGGNGDVVVTITNNNPYPVTITAVQLPTNTTYASGFSNSSLTTAQAGCAAATPSDVIWNFSTATSGSSHTLTSALTVAASGTLAVTFTNDASMTSAAPAACASTYFSMPSLTGVTATGGAATATSSPATDSWTS
ncbi:MAG TPA: hypothetical protein VFV02_16015 [Acidimicrobiales bacterium]|nr:hypothetical protein [Acidimicrobiales bacterium]